MGGSAAGRGRPRRGRLGQAFDVGLGRDADLVGDLLAKLLEPVGNADLRFGHKVDSPQLQGLERDFGTPLGQGGDHHHRHRAKAHQLGQEVDAIHARHLHVQRDDVGIEVADHLPRGKGIGRRADAFHVRLVVDDLAEQAAHQGGIVHHHHACLGHLVGPP